MIFITVGTTQYPFRRLIDWGIAQAIQYPNTRFVIQSGCYQFKEKIPKNVKIQQYFSFEQTQEYLKNAKKVVCHAGMGTIIQCWSYGKIPIVVPRLFKYGEHANDHESEISGYLLSLGEITVLDLCRMKIEKKVLKQKIFRGNKLKLIKYLHLIK